MSRIRALIAEDEAPQRRALLVLLADLWPELEIVAECADGVSARDALSAFAPQVAFLDIRLPGPSGLQLADSLAPHTHLVFITAYDEYAVRAFDAGAVDYLLKPVTRERLAQTIARLRERIASATPPALEALLTALREAQAPQREPLRWITASLGDTVRLISVDDVLFFQAQDKVTRVVTADGEAIIRLSLRELLAQLDPQDFWQIHRSTVVRAAAIDRVKRDELGRMRVWLRVGAREASRGVAGESLSVSETFQWRFRGM